MEEFLYYLWWNRVVHSIVPEIDCHKTPDVDSVIAAALIPTYTTSHTACASDRAPEIKVKKVSTPEYLLLWQAKSGNTLLLDGLTMLKPPTSQERASPGNLAPLSSYHLPLKLARMCVQDVSGPNPHLVPR